MAYKRGLPTFNKGIEPEVKRTTVQNPEGTTTYKTSWSSTTPGRSSSFKAPASKQEAKPVAKRSTPAQKTAGEREITTFPNVKAAGMKSQDITAPKDIKVPVKTITRKERFESDKEDWKKKHPGEVWEDRYKDVETTKTEREWKGSGRFKEKKGVKLCKTC